MGEWYELEEWAQCPNCGAGGIEFDYSADDGTKAYSCPEGCGARLEIW